MRDIIINLYKIKVFKRLIPSLLKIFIKILNKNTTVIKHNGLLLNLNLKNPIDREIYLTESYENTQVEYFKELIIQREIEIFIDIGSHMGFYTINLSKVVKKVYSFEPIVENYNQLIKNIKINDYQNIETYNLALSNTKSMVEMWVPNKDKTGGFSIYNKTDEELRLYKLNKLHKKKVSCELLDSLLSFKDKKISIKIDVERHEKNVIDGAKNLLKKNNVLIQVEIFESRKDEIIKILGKMNYKLINKIDKDYYFINY